MPTTVDGPLAAAVVAAVAAAAAAAVAAAVAACVVAAAGAAAAAVAATDVAVAVVVAAAFVADAVIVIVAAFVAVVQASMRPCLSCGCFGFSVLCRMGCGRVSAANAFGGQTSMTGHRILCMRRRGFYIATHASMSGSGARPGAPCTVCSTVRSTLFC